MADEIKTDDKKEAEHPAGDTGKGDNSQGLDKIERANLAVKRMEEAERRLDEKIAKLTELETNRILGSTAGGRVESVSKVETAKEYADRVMKNTVPVK